MVSDIYNIEDIANTSPAFKVGILWRGERGVGPYHQTQFYLFIYLMIKG